MTDLRDSRSITSEEVLAFLWSKRNNRGLLKCDQKALASEFGCDYTKFHRTVNQLLEDGLLKVVAIGSRGLKTYKVSDPADNSQAENIS
jgi:DNA-binding MarR family transcriptional regulator